MDGVSVVELLWRGWCSGMLLLAWIALIDGCITSAKMPSDGARPDLALDSAMAVAVSTAAAGITFELQLGE